MIREFRNNVETNIPDSIMIDGENCKAGTYWSDVPMVYVYERHYPFKKKGKYLKIAIDSVSPNVWTVYAKISEHEYDNDDDLVIACKDTDLTGMMDTIEELGAMLDGYEVSE